MIRVVLSAAACLAVASAMSTASADCGGGHTYTTMSPAATYAMPHGSGSWSHASGAYAPASTGTVSAASQEVSVYASPPVVVAPTTYAYPGYYSRGWPTYSGYSYPAASYSYYPSYYYPSYYYPSSYYRPYYSRPGLLGRGGVLGTGLFR